MRGIGAFVMTIFIVVIVAVLIFNDVQPWIAGCIMIAFFVGLWLFDVGKKEDKS